VEKLGFALELKSTAEASGLGKFRGLGSVYGNLDLHGDVVMRGAFDKTLKERGGRVPLLWQHDMAQPIGIANLEDSRDGLVVEGELDLDIPEGRRAFSGMKRGYLKGLSIGYNALKDEFKDGKRLLHEIDLWEMSVVTFGANPKATITHAKQAAEVAAIASALREAMAERTALIKGIGGGTARAEDDEALRMFTLNHIRRMRAVVGLLR
jgi:HK97 family phage prohead protease